LIKRFYVEGGLDLIKGLVQSRSKARHHHPIFDELSDIEEDSDGSDRDEYSFRLKRLTRIDVSNPLSAFDVKTNTKLSHIKSFVRINGTQSAVSLASS
jgi:hypothetical protein